MEKKNKSFRNMPHLYFTKYNNGDLEQVLFLKDIAIDDEISKYINNIVSDVTKAITNGSSIITSFLIKDKDINEYIGLCTIKPALYDTMAVSIEYAVHKKYRFSNQKYGSRMLLGVTNLLFASDNFSKIVLEIKGDNIPSLMAAINAGFDIDYGLVEKFYEEGYQYIPYTKYNQSYRNIYDINSIDVR